MFWVIVLDILIFVAVFYSAKAVYFFAAQKKRMRGGYFEPSDYAKVVFAPHCWTRKQIANVADEGDTSYIGYDQESDKYKLSILAFVVVVLTIFLAGAFNAYKAESCYFDYRKQVAIAEKGKSTWDDAVSANSKLRLSKSLAEFNPAMDSNLKESILSSQEITLTSEMEMESYDPESTIYNILYVVMWVIVIAIIAIGIVLGGMWLYCVFAE